MTKEEMLKKFEVEHPRHYLFRESKTERKDRMRKERGDKLWDQRTARLALIVKRRLIDKWSLRRIGKEAGISPERVRQILIRCE